MIFDHISNHILPQMKNLNTVIPIEMYFLTINIENALFFTKCECHKRPYNHDVNQSQATLLMTQGFRQYIAEYTVANFCCYPIRHCITFSSALECSIVDK